MKLWGSVASRGFGSRQVARVEVAGRDPGECLGGETSADVALDIEGGGRAQAGCPFWTKREVVGPRVQVRNVPKSFEYPRFLRDRDNSSGAGKSGRPVPWFGLDCGWTISVAVLGEAWKGSIRRCSLTSKPLQYM